ncbi:urease accessory protein UreE [Salmonella enterica subsp. salamae]|nr:urease accessory protein UreE [Salmonella enterica subsp. salamae]ECF6094482.1 urease accessory protein UreE [Salmonella enterica subsp. salamae]EDW5993899.1 urease accessory protein UreE [Salmonella enterica subsp. salamae]
MIVIEKILGNIKQDADWHERLQYASVDVLTLSQREAQKSRCRRTTHDGQDLGISLDRHQMLTDGDVLLWDKVNRSAVVVQINLSDVMMIDLQSLLTTDIATVLRTAFELGHALGNQHWKSVIKGKRIFIPLTVATQVMDSVMKNHGFHTLPYSFVKGESILPHLTQAEARLLFGGAENSATHVHVNGHLPSQ